MPLAKIGYFSQFGKDRAVFYFINKMEKHNYCRAASYSRTEVENDINLARIIDKYCSGLTKQGTPAARYTVQYENSEQLSAEKRAINKQIKELRIGGSDEDSYEIVSLKERIQEIENEIDAKIFEVNLKMWEEYEQIIFAIPCDDLDYKTRIENQLDVLGTVDFTTNREEDRRKLIVMKIVPLGTSEIWGYAVSTKSIGSGKLGRFTVREWQYRKEPIAEKDVIFADNVSKNQKGYWYLNEYHHIYS